MLSSSSNRKAPHLVNHSENQNKIINLVCGVYIIYVGIVWPIVHYQLFVYRSLKFVNIDWRNFVSEFRIHLMCRTRVEFWQLYDPILCAVDKLLGGRAWLEVRAPGRKGGRYSSIMGIARGKSNKVLNAAD